MLQQMDKLWWKITGAVLVLFSIIAGLWLPVGPGVDHVSPTSLTTGRSIALQITGYNTHFKSAAPSQQVWLRHAYPGDTLYLCLQQLDITGEDHLSAAIDLPQLPTVHANKTYDLVLNNDVDGSFVLRDAILIRQSGKDSASAEVPACTPTVSVNDPAYLSLPHRIILYETIRNLFFHVPMWFVMTALLLLSFIAAILYLRHEEAKWDLLSAELVNVAIFFGLLGFATGSLWGNFTWGNLGDWVLRDTKVLGSLIALLMYLAYFVLRGSLPEAEKKARIGAVYNIFAFVLFIVFIYVLPRMSSTLHPGSGNNPAFNIYDVDDTMRWIFYPAVLGWILVGLWLSSIRTRMRYVAEKIQWKKLR